MATTIKHIILSMLNLNGIGPAFIGKQAANIKEASVVGWSLDQLMEKCGKSGFDSGSLEVAEEAAAKSLELAQMARLKVIHFLENAYPEKLKGLGIKWPVVFVKGSVSLEDRTIGIIGSRDSTPIGEKIAQRLGAHFADEDFRIVNGAARGIDAAATSDPLALRRSLAVVPGGLAFEVVKTLGKVYQEEAERILEGGGALISGFLPGEKQNQFKLSEYCKLQAALSNALILVQSKVDGGSRFTLEGFARLSRPLGIVDASNFELKQKEAYAANALILAKGRDGVAEICKLKPEKVLANIYPIRHKEEYLQLVRAMNSPKQPGTLF